MQDTAEVIVAAAGSKATYVGSGVATASWWFSNEAGVAIGIALGVIGLIVNIVFSVRKDRREKKLLDAKLRAIKFGVNDAKIES